LVRNNAALALDDLGWKPLNIESEAIYSVAKKDWENCIKIGPPAVDALIAALKKGIPVQTLTCAVAWQMFWVKLVILKLSNP